MNEDWISRWRDNNTPWDRGEVNPQLCGHFDQLDVPPGGTVLVPLCGGTEDLWWLLQRGCAVTGIELAREPVDAFLERHGLAAQERQTSFGTELTAGNLRVLVGDLFAVRRTDVGHVDAVYDRAALDAFPPADQPGYLQSLLSLIPDSTPMLTVTLEFPLSLRMAPPFSVGESQIKEALAGRRPLRLLAREDALAREPQLKAHGVEQLFEVACLIGAARVDIG